MSNCCTPVNMSIDWFGLSHAVPQQNHNILDLTKATDIIMVPTRIRFLITPLLSAWQCGPNSGFSWGGGWGGETDAPNRLFTKGV